MATIVSSRGFSTATDGTSFTTSSFNPIVGELLSVWVLATACTLETPTLTDSQGGTYALISKTTKAAGADSLYHFVRNSLIPATTAMSYTFDCTGDAATGFALVAFGISAMLRTGADAVKQHKEAANQSAAGTPSLTFDASCLTSNPTLGIVASATNPPGLTPPTSWTESRDEGNTTAAIGYEIIFRNSGFAGTTITWSNTSATAFAAGIVEFDTTRMSSTGAAPGTATAEATGKSKAAAPGAAAGTSTATSISSGKAVAAGNAAGTSSAEGTGKAIFRAAGSTAGAATAAAASQDHPASQGIAAGHATANATAMNQLRYSAFVFESKLMAASGYTRIVTCDLLKAWVEVNTLMLMQHKTINLRDLGWIRVDWWHGRKMKDPRHPGFYYPTGKWYAHRQTYIRAV